VFELSSTELILSIIQIIIAVALIAIVLLQSGKRSGLSGAIAGGMDTFLSKNQARTWDARFAKITKWVAIVFITLTLALMLIRANAGPF
jgi:preprotein translocase subunit SecG